MASTHLRPAPFASGRASNDGFVYGNKLLTFYHSRAVVSCIWFQLPMLQHEVSESVSSALLPLSVRAPSASGSDVASAANSFANPKSNTFA